ncbi:MAG TPA: hypothetical protein VKA31_00360 [Mariprofundaceae bacterium]|nr:hypothetical protein [Mariprofundaceae bacterium]
MPESHVVSGLKSKRDEIKRAILDYEQKIKTARADLATLNEALAIFGEFSGNPKKYFERRQLFERGELMRIIMDAFRDAPDGLTTRELTEIAMEAKGFDLDDDKLFARVTHSVGNALAGYKRAKQIRADGVRQGVQVWKRTL